MYVYRLAGYGAIAPIYGIKCLFYRKEERETAWHLLWRCERRAEYRTRFLGWMRGCQKLNTCENPREKKFLRILLGGGSHASYNLRVKITAAVATYLSVVVRVRAKLLRKAVH
ncbi:putative transposable element encoded protein [Trachipleistophora hominis]|uniref:Putative transposable element encoded protein n=1 Tax=Trachipleistophora hominis TaxID=72359 RepID=L7JZH7_TRAHO|nr:putative transposable element encoded protein [Trachipleistophora hominis]